MESTSSAAATTFTAANSDYDVFINHRGPDSKKTLATSLYRSLLSHGIRVFLDQPEMKPGEYITAQIEGAIRSASIHVAIFSVGYAQSRWCLDELVLMVQSKAPIIPVFYHVEPADLRWKGRYAEALVELGKKTSSDPRTREEKLRYDFSTIENWRNALSQVAGISGFVHGANSDEAELLTEVVKEVLKRVKTPALAFEVAKYPTGLDDKIKDFENKVLEQPQHRKPSVLGIVGLGGVGKTTLVKELFNRKASNYNTKSCFLSDVRDGERNGSLISFQKKLLKSLNISEHKKIERIDCVDQGKVMLRKDLSSVGALVIIDDVDHDDQVDALLPHGTPLHSASLILITSRNMDVLTRVENISIYKLTGLDTAHAEELFCFHAFNQSYPLRGFESLVMKFLATCDGLPLSLKVFGALLYKNEDKCYWQSLLDKLEVPIEIHDKLKISYDSLSKGERQIFLDIACFFIGEDKDMAIKIWDASDWNGLCGFQNIRNKCLVEVNSENKIKMHDQLRDMGREIAKASGAPHRLWRWTENTAEDLLLQSLNAQITPVRGIRMVLSEYNDIDDDDALGRIHISGLRLLDTEGGLMERIRTKVQMRNLIWLRWSNCPDSSFPSIISMKNLRVLQVQGNKLESLPASLGQLTKLTVLDICQTGISDVSFAEGACINLQFLNISGGSDAEVSFAEGACINLQSLNISSGSDAEVSFAEGACINLQSLNIISRSDAVVSFAERGGCINFQCLDISSGRDVVVQSLNISSGSDAVVSFAEGGGCINFQCLKISSGRDAVVSFVGGAYFNLRDLYISSGSDAVVSSAEGGACINFQCLNISCGSVAVVSFAEGACFSLQELNISCGSDAKVSFAEGACINFQRLNISSGSNAVVSFAEGACNFQRLNIMTRIRRLNMSSDSDVLVSLAKSMFM